MTPTPHRLRLAFGAALAVCLVAEPSILYAADRLVPGRWEFTMTSDGASRVVTSCMTAEDAKQFNGDSASGKAAAEKKNPGNCTIQSFTAVGDTVAYTLVCGSRTISNTTAFHGDTSDGTTTTTVSGKVVTSHVKARRIGACP